MRIAVIYNQKAEGVKEALNPVCEALRSMGAEVLLPTSREAFPSSDIGMLLARCDLAVALGGDGTIIHVAKHAARLNRPVLGVNGGHIGFMAGLEANELDYLPRLLNGEYTVCNRMMLEVTVQSPGRKESRYALNEAVIARGPLSRMIGIKIRNGEEAVTDFHADGVIVATPTGSTAYSLSAGGPIVDPALECLLMTPVCAHSLQSHACVFPKEAVLHIRTTAPSGTQVFLSVDGEENISIDDFTKVTFRRAEIGAQLIYLKPQSFYETLDRKISHRR